MGLAGPKFAGPGRAGPGRAGYFRPVQSTTTGLPPALSYSISKVEDWRNNVFVVYTDCTRKTKESAVGYMHRRRALTVWMSSRNAYNHHMSDIGAALFPIPSDLSDCVPLHVQTTHTSVILDV